MKLNFSASSIRNDHLTLLEFRKQVNQDPHGLLNSWNESIHFCNWKGISCSLGRPERVTGLDLRDQRLQGTLSPYLGNLTFLTLLVLSNNSFHGEIPQELGSLFYLRVLNFSDNKLDGKIPVQLMSLVKLQGLDLAKNAFTGHISPSIGNLSSLVQLSLGQNHFYGSIPDDICHLRNLSFLQVDTNNFTGEVPSCLYNHSYLAMFSVSENSLEGSLPLNFGVTLPNIKQLYLALNRFTGPIPVSILNASKLETIAFQYNNFTGLVPRDIGKLQGLRYLDFSSNQMGTDNGDDLSFIDSLTNCGDLEQLATGNNFLLGQLPKSIANLSTSITLFQVGGNQIYGSIPAGFRNLVNLETLYLERNNLTGKIPEDLGGLVNLQKVYLQGNHLSGLIPDSIGNMTKLTHLHLGENSLIGSIPLSLENCLNLFFLNLSYNNLSGTIPAHLLSLSSLTLSLNLDHNYLYGSIPSEVGNLTNLVMLDVSENRLSGQIPESLGLCLNLVYLNMGGNSFEGNIPKSLNTLRGVVYFDLSSNNLSGEIPEYLTDFPDLVSLNLSFNHFEGPVPNNGTFQNLSMVSIVGNNKLCGGVVQLRLPPCLTHEAARGTKKKSLPLKVIIPVIIAGLCLFLSMIFVICSRQNKFKSLIPQIKLKVSYADLFKAKSLIPQIKLKVSYADLFKATNGFSAENLVGAVCYGSVYKGIFDLEHLYSNQSVAVKVISLQQEGALESYLSECDVLRYIRHRNLVKIITTCSTVDFQGNDFKAIVFKFMPKGSLEEWLHPRLDAEHEQKNLKFAQRLSIVIDIANALEYLHHQCEPVMVHCDLKPSNILLDDDMTAHVANFGLPEFKSAPSHFSTPSEASSVSIKRTIGHLPPEYGKDGEVSIEIDVYSYGILLLEMFTKKRPTDEMFRDGLNLHNYAKMALPDQVREILDPALLASEDVGTMSIENQNDRQELILEYSTSILQLGILCSAESSKERLSMVEVVKELYNIRGY
ncbi:hypothetical protein AQUCO_06300035v1 [Aquilegia coerulea]|uniref:non-specific serine/threonine protein kinase n=1 Tax=Aquilegia coerulea TaxID=218851 RepID=A0A2G5CCT1_AQUCA|nr:hypothetical protein AQUCO_06300035v1 [Aquilegia coerulea]